MGSLPSAALCLLCVVAGSAAADAQPRQDPRVLEAIGWYTGTAGRVDDAKARALIDAAATDGDVLARMWLARAWSRGRLGYPRDEARARTAELHMARAEMLAAMPIQQLSAEAIATGRCTWRASYQAGWGLRSPSTSPHMQKSPSFGTSPKSPPMASTRRPSGRRRRSGMSCQHQT